MPKSFEIDVYFLIYEQEYGNFEFGDMRQKGILFCSFV